MPPFLDVETADTRIPSEVICDLLQRDPHRSLWILAEPRFGRTVDWQTIRTIAERMRLRPTVADAYVEALTEALEKYSVVQVFESKPVTPFGYEANTI